MSGRASTDPPAPPLATPTSPEPPAELIREAKRGVALYLARLSRPSPDTNMRMNAQTLACGVRDLSKCPLAVAEWAIYRLIEDDLLEIAQVLPEALSNYVPLSRFIVRATDGLWSWWREGHLPSGKDKPKGDGAGQDPAGAGQGKGGESQTNSSKPKATKKRLEESQKKTDKLKLQVYDYIEARHADGVKPAGILAELKGNKDRKKQVLEAGLKLDKKMIRAALSRRGQRERDKKSKKQDSPSA
jgi:hypothetical protein